MALTAAELNVRFTSTGADRTRGEIEGLGRAVNTTARNTGILRTAFGTAGGFIGANLFVGAIQGVKELGSAVIWGASNTTEALSKVNQVFGTSANVVTDWAATADRNFGLTEVQALDTAGALGNLFTNMGIGRGVAAQMSTELLGLAGDMSSFFNVSSPEIITAMTSAFVGEYDALQRLGVPINQAAVEQYALNNGIWDGTAALTEQQRVLAVQGLLWQSTTNAQGDYARTSGELANSTRTLKAMLSNLAADLGGALLPAAKGLTQWGIGAVGWIAGLTDRFQTLRNAGFSPMRAAMAVLNGELTKAFGSAAAARILSFVRGAIAGFQSFLGIIRTVAGVVRDALGGALGFIIDHFDVIGPIVAGAVAGFLAFSAVMGTVSAVAGVVAPILAAIAAQGGLVAAAIALITSPVLLVAAAFAALFLAYQKNFLRFADGVNAVVDAVVPKLQQFWEWIQRLRDAFSTGGWSAVWNELRVAAGGALDYVMDRIRGIVDAIRNVDWGGFLAGAWDAIQSGLQLAWDSITSIDWSEFIPDVDWGALLSTAGDLGLQLINHIKSLITSVDWMDLFTKAGSLGSQLSSHITGLISSVDWKELFTRAGSLGSQIGGHIVGMISAVDWKELFTKAGSLGAQVGGHILGLITAIDWKELFTKSGSLGAQVGGHIVGLITAVDWLDLFSKAGSLGAQIGGHLISLITSVEWIELFTKAASLKGAIEGHLISLITSVDWKDLFTRAASLQGAIEDHITSLITSVEWMDLFTRAAELGGRIGEHIVSLITSADWMELFTKATAIGGRIADHIISLITSVDWLQLFTKANSLANPIQNHLISLITSVDWMDLFTKANSLANPLQKHIIGLITSVDWRELFTKGGSLATRVGTHLISKITTVDWMSLFTKGGSLASGMLEHLKSKIVSVDWTALFGDAIDLGADLLAWIKEGLGDIPDFPDLPSKDEILDAITGGLLGSSDSSGAAGNQSVALQEQNLPPSSQNSGKQLQSPKPPPLESRGGFDFAAQIQQLSQLRQELSATASTVPVFTGAIGTIPTIATPAFDALKGAFINARLTAEASLSGIKDSVTGRLGESVIAAQATAPIMGAAGTLIGTALGTSVSTSTAATAPLVNASALKLVDSARSTSGASAQAGTLVGTTFGRSESGGMTAMGGTVFSAAAGLVNRALSTSGQASGAGSTVGRAFGQGKSSGISGMGGAVAGAAGGLVRSAIGGGSGAGPGGRSIGNALGSGVVAGIAAQAAAAAAAAGDLVRRAISAALSAGAISSPSKHMRNLVGRNLGLGAIVGIEDMMPRMDRAMRELVSIPRIDPIAISPSWQATAMPRMTYGTDTVADRWAASSRSTAPDRSQAVQTREQVIQNFLILSPELLDDFQESVGFYRVVSSREEFEAVTGRTG